jgi:hypothetical protein
MVGGAGSAEEKEEYVRSAEEDRGELAGSMKEEDKKRSVDHGEHSGLMGDEQMGSAEKRLRFGFADLAGYFPLRWLV